MKHVYLSFADENGFIGCAVVEAESLEREDLNEAIHRIDQLPTVCCQVSPLELHPDDHGRGYELNRLYSLKEACEAFGRMVNMHTGLEIQ